MNFINLHAHSKYSDGNATLEQHMFAQRKLGFSAVVLTDHVYMDNYVFSMDRKKFLAQCVESDILQQKYGIPFIIGIELSVMRMEECNIFGFDAIMEIFNLREKGVITKDDLVEIKKNYNCIINLNHPMHPHRFIDAGCMEFLDAYEHIHTGEPVFDITFTKPKEFENIVELCNSDAHDLSMLEWCYNQSEVPIYTENDLIFYIKNRKKFKHINNIS